MAESIQGMKRSCRVAEVTAANIGEELCLMGWCHKQRDLGSLIFITLRDRSGELQLILDDSCPSEVWEKAKQVRSEYVLAVRGILRERQDPNLLMPTGRWELKLSELRILAEAKTPPFYIEDKAEARETLRLEHRYLDLRRPEMQQRLIKRHEIVKFTRDWFGEAGFIDIETPMLIKSTPEGARDYLVPSRVFKGSFFALPQSPQLYKQLLMCAGYDRYMQIARCFRDEDLRADRQPEFTQIDLEMSFVTEAEVRDTLEAYLRDLLRRFLQVETQLPLRCLSYAEAMARYGSDKPDTRFGLELQDVSDLCQESEFKLFQEALASGGTIRGLCLPKGGSLARRRLDELGEFVKNYRAKALVWLQPAAEARSSALKFLSPELIRRLAERFQAGPDDMIFLIGGETELCLEALGHLRLELARSLQLIPANTWDLLWVTDFPLFEYDAAEQRFVAKHHPFTMPKLEDLPLLESNPTACRAQAYDMILNGTELGGGSIRIHDPALQEKIFALIGFSPAEARERFSFLLNAFAYGVPPHGGLAFGLDRLVMLLTGVDNIREVIAFPKVQNSSCLMSACPAPVAAEQLAELGLHLKPINPKENLDG